MQLWKDVVNYEGLYQVSNSGKIKSLRNNIILKPRKKKNGYLQVVLYKNNVKNKLIHRLVGEAFIPNPLHLSYINHKNKIKSDNRVGNLEWCTPKYNNDYSQSYKINQYDLDNNLIKSWNSMRDAERELNISHSDISKCCKKIYKQAGGYIWKFKKGDDV